MVMRVSISTAFLALCVCLAGGAASAASGSYLCAISEVYECQAVTGCQRASLDAINLSAFIVLDLDKKQLTGVAIGQAGRTEDIEGLTSNDKEILLYGTQGDDTWNASVSLATGALTGGIASDASSFALFGNCTPK
jgi:hypothetical protein